MAKIIDAVKGGYIEFKDQFKRNMQFYKRLSSEGQNPFVMYIGCSDSRVIPEKILNLKEGDVFVVRNVANLVPPYGDDHKSVAAAIEFAIHSLKIEQVIVCGHTDCGGMNALLKPAEHQQYPDLLKWVEQSKPILDKKFNEENHLTELVKRNVLRQKENLLTYPFIKEAYEMGELEIHSWIYDLEKGNILTYSYTNDDWEPI